MMLAWLSSSEKIDLAAAGERRDRRRYSPGNPAPNSSAASLPWNSASRRSSVRCRSMFPRDQPRGARCRRPSARPRRRRPGAPAGGRPGRGSCSSRAAGPRRRRAGRAVPAGPRSAASGDAARARGAPRFCRRRRSRVEPPSRPSRQAARRPASSLGRFGIGGRLALLLDHPQLCRRVPEVGVGLAVDQLVDRRIGDLRRLALEPAVAVVRTRIGAVVGLAGDVEARAPRTSRGRRRARRRAWSGSCPSSPR